MSGRSGRDDLPEPVSSRFQAATTARVTRAAAPASGSPLARAMPPIAAQGRKFRNPRAPRTSTVLTRLPARQTNHLNPEDQVLKKDLARVMKKCLEGLADAAEKMILVARTLESVTLRQLAEQFSCSIEKIRQTEIRAKSRMRTCLEKHDWNLQ